MTKRLLLLSLFVLFLGCSSINQSLIVSIPIEKYQKESPETVKLSSSARFLLGVIPLDGIDRFEENTFEVLLFNVMSQESSLDSTYELIGYENLIHRKTGILTYELTGFYKQKSTEELDSTFKVTPADNRPFKKVDSVTLKTINESEVSRIAMEDQYIPPSLDAILKARGKKEIERQKVIIVACYRPDSFDKTLLNTINKLESGGLKYYTTENWVKVYVDKEGTIEELYRVRDIYPDAWLCRYGK